MAVAPVTVAVAENRWRARPRLAGLLRALLLAVPLVASSAAVYLLARWLPADAARSWWGLAAMLALGVLVATAVERAARRLLPIALLLKLSMIFPDQAPSRLRLARTAAVRPREELLWTGRTLEPTSTSDLVLALIGALGAHDRRTRGHSERVRLLCDVLAVELGLDDEDRDRLRWSALLHDVGKVEVPARILNKPSALDDAEFDKIRLHPAAGAVLAAPLLPWLGRWGDGILDHHERYDGSGYPAGKAGDDISEAGRLIAVIDAFETMTAARPYKKAMATRAARTELARCAGTHFDPVYVRAFLAVSLPRVLWAMGPLSFLLQLPFLSSIAQTGVRAGAALPQAAGTLAAGAAGAAVIAGGGAGTAGPAPAVATDKPATAVGQQAERPEPEGRPGGAVLEPAAPARVVLPTASAPAGPTATSAPVTRAQASPAPPPPPRPTSPEPSPATATTAAPEAAPAARPDEEHTAIKSGPPPTTSSRTAEFELTEVPGTQWECQLIGAANGEPSRWEPCAGTFSVTVVRDGDQVLRVRDADTRDVVDAWEWTVVPESGQEPGQRATPPAAADGARGAGSPTAP